MKKIFIAILSMFVFLSTQSIALVDYFDDDFVCEFAMNGEDGFFPTSSGYAYGIGYTYPPSSYYIDFFLSCDGGYGGYINMTWMDGYNYNYFYANPTNNTCFNTPFGKVVCGYGNGYFNGNMYPSFWCINLDTMGVALIVDEVEFVCTTMDQGTFIPINWTTSPDFGLD